MKNLLCFLVGLVLLCGVFGMVSTASAAGSASGPLYGVKDICVFHPYAGTPRDFFISITRLENCWRLIPGESF